MDRFSDTNRSILSSDEISSDEIGSIQVIDHGYVTLSSPPSNSIRVPGPGIVVINSANAVVFEREGTITRICGPGVIETNEFEFFRSIIDLREQISSLGTILTYTRDGVAVSLELTLGYRVMIDEDALINRGEYVFDDETIRRASLQVSNWRIETEYAGSRVLREAIASYTLDDLFDPTGDSADRPTLSPRENIQAHVLRRLNAVTKEWGVVVRYAQLSEIEIPSEIREALLHRALTLLSNQEKEVSEKSPTEDVKVFIGHGHNEIVRYKVKNFIRDRCGLTPLILQELPSAGMTIIEKLEKYGRIADYAVLILTGDDVTQYGEARARQNVIQELGWFQGTLGRNRTALLVESGVELLSNISGVVFLKFEDNAVESVFEDLRKELEEAGFL